MPTFALVIPVVALVATFTLISIGVWVGSRKEEREAFYRADLLKKIAESPAESARQVIELMREEDRQEELRAARQQADGLRLGGFVLLAVGLGLGLMLELLSPAHQMWSVGLIPALIGVALLAYLFFFVSRGVA